MAKPDIYTRVTDKIIAALEAGVRPWHKPWNAEHLAGRVTRPLRGNGIPYRGINVILLWCASVDRGLSAPIWMTYKQAQDLGAQVRKGAKGETVVYANTLHKTETDDNGEEVELAIPYLKTYTVFTVEEIDGLPEHYYATARQMPEGIERDAAAEAFFAATGADIRHGGNRASYLIGPDYVQMPPFEAFEDPAAYYSALGHEMIHWTRHSTRLDRGFGRKHWGDEGYAQEELVAELGAAFLCADLRLTPEPRDEHAAYIANWLTALKNDKRFIFHAAAHAQRAVEYLHQLQPAAEERDELAA